MKRFARFPRLCPGDGAFAVGFALALCAALLVGCLAQPQPSPLPPGAHLGPNGVTFLAPPSAAKPSRGVEDSAPATHLVPVPHPPNPKSQIPPRRIYGAAIGGQGGKPDFGARTADIRDFGAVTTADAAPAIQRAYDSLISGGYANSTQNLSRGVVFIPSGVWPMGSPLMADACFIDVIGERGAVLSCKASSILSYPIIAGFKRAVNWAGGDPHYGDPAVFPTDHRIDLYGKVDTTLASSPATRYGLRSRSPSTVAGANVAGHWVEVWGSPPATGCGDLWKDTRVFTLELAIENPRGAMGTVSICGMGAIGGTMGTSGAQGGPWTLVANGTSFLFSFNTLEGANGVPRTFSFGDATLSGVQKIWIEMDFTQNDSSGFCLIRAGQNGIQKTVTRGAGTRQAAQNFQVSTHATGGSFTLTDKRLDTNVTTLCTIQNSYNASQIQTQLDTVYGAGNTVVTGGGVGAGFTYTIAGSLVNLNQGGPVVDGTNLTGVTGGGLGYSSEAGFLAGQTIHFAPNYLAPFWFFGDCFSGGDQFVANGVSVLNLYGFELSNCLRYTAGAPATAEIRVDSATNTDVLRYATLDASTVVIFNPDDPPHMPSKTWDGLVRFTLGAAAGGATGVDTFGLFALNLLGFPPPENFDLASDQTYKQLRLESWGPMGGGGVYCHNLFNGRFDDCDFFGGWQGLTLFGGYDYSIRNAIGFGADAFLFASTAIVKQTGVQRIAVGNTAYRLSGCVYEAQGLVIEASNLNQGMPGGVQDGTAQAGGASTITLSTAASSVNNAYQNCLVRTLSGTGGVPSQLRTIANGGYVGSTRVATVTVPWSTLPDSTTAYQVEFPNALTESLIRVHPDGTYGYRYYFGGLGTDNELGGGIPPLFHGSRCSGTVGPSLVRLTNFSTSGQGLTPAIVLDGGQTTGAFANFHPGNIWVHNLATDGTEVAVDGPGWNVRIDTTELPLDGEAIRYTGPPGASFPLHVKRQADLTLWPPPAGRFIAGTVWLDVWNPAAGAVSRYVCTATGTAAYSSTYTYGIGAYVSYSGTEYVCVALSLGNLPTNATYWMALGSVSVPTFKALETVAP